MGQADLAHELFGLINPIHHAEAPSGAERYRVEPYVIAADVYSMPPHNGRGGWTWYTGSASWMYRLGVERLLGIERSGNQLRIRPCIPASWKGYPVSYRYGNSRYHIRIENHGDDTVQLRTRYWRITDSMGRVQEVRGAGVDGEQPVLRPGESYEYRSHLFKPYV